jgi:MFS family permease
MHCGQRGIAIIAPSLKIIAYVVICNHPPYPILPIVLTLAGFGNGLEDGAWNAWVGNMVRANELMGILHGAYGLGATISPIISTTMVTKANLPWYRYYLVLVSTKSSPNRD